MRTFLKHLLLGFLLGVFSCLSGCFPSRADWSTIAELSNYELTSSYERVVEYCNRLQAACPWIQLQFIGRTPEGRRIPVLIVSKDRAFTPQRAAADDKVTVLISNGIHAGEIEGKEACLALVRDITINKTRAALLDHANLVILPIFNIDGHERVSPYNRINQDGPRNMGWRCTAQNLNLNRDFMKADAPEMRAWLKMFHAWRPHLVIDTHTTDGADFQYDITFDTPNGDETALPVSQWTQRRLEPYLLSALNKDGHQPQVFFDMIDRLDPAKGITEGGLLPRFCTGYAAINNRPGILVETHMSKPFAVRVKATYALLVHTLELINSEPQPLLDALARADSQTSQAAMAKRPANQVVVATTQPANAPGEPIVFKGYDYRMVSSAASGAEYPVWDRSKPVDIPSRLFRATAILQSVPVPHAFIIPPMWTAAIDRARVHDLPCLRLKKALTLKVETAKFKNAKWREKPFEGRHEVSFDFELITETRQFPAGSLVVQTNTPLAKLAVHLLHPAAPDALVRWGFFDAIFEQKEYFEDYVMAPLADRMLEKRATLRTEFDEWLNANPELASNARARLEFFYQRTRYWDKRKDVYPVAWINDRAQMSLITEK